MSSKHVAQKWITHHSKAYVSELSKWMCFRSFWSQWSLCGKLVHRKKNHFIFVVEILMGINGNYEKNDVLKLLAYVTGLDLFLFVCLSFSQLIVDRQLFCAYNPVDFSF